MSSGVMVGTAAPPGFHRDCFRSCLRPPHPLLHPGQRLLDRVAARRRGRPRPHRPAGASPGRPPGPGPGAGPVVPEDGVAPPQARTRADRHQRRAGRRRRAARPHRRHERPAAPSAGPGRQPLPGAGRPVLPAPPARRRAAVQRGPGREQPRLVEAHQPAQVRGRPARRPPGPRRAPLVGVRPLLRGGAARFFCGGGSTGSGCGRRRPGSHSPVGGRGSAPGWGRAVRREGGGPRRRVRRGGPGGGRREGGGVAARRSARAGAGSWRRR
jgi:hypothetical protein